jgi:hypothetical protein
MSCLSQGQTMRSKGRLQLAMTAMGLIWPECEEAGIKFNTLREMAVFAHYHVRPWRDPDARSRCLVDQGMARLRPEDECVDRLSDDPQGA